MNAGSNASGANTAGNGGSGITCNILPYTDAGTGDANVGEVQSTNVYYGGGGGGGYNYNGAGAAGTFGIGGLGGGGNGGGGSLSTPSYTAEDGKVNSGGGAGGPGGNTITPAKTGGSGVVILRYPDTRVLAVDSGTLVQPTNSPYTDGTDKVSVFTSGSGLVSFSDAAPGTTVDFLVVGGAGSGGGDNSSTYFGGGGGGGGFRTSIASDGNGGGQTADSALSIVTLTNYDLKVGNGGTYVNANGATDSGDDSIFGSITSKGGGGGGPAFGAGQNGGSGGGGACSSDPATQPQQQVKR